MRLALVSDTHHSTPFIPDWVDGVLFCGDFCCTHRGTKAINLEYKVWEYIYAPYLESIRNRNIKVYGIPGNHDFLAALEIDRIRCHFDEFKEEGFFDVIDRDTKETMSVYAYCYHHLQDFPFFKTGEEMYDDLTPLSGNISCDILMTHSPPIGLFDKGGPFGEHYGSHAIRDFVTVLRPKLHVFGHVHEARNHGIYGSTHYVNASYTSEDSKMPMNKIYIWNSEQGIKEESTHEWRK